MPALDDLGECHRRDLITRSSTRWLARHRYDGCRIGASVHRRVVASSRRRVVASSRCRVVASVRRRVSASARHRITGQ
ncbi:hypothetical protein ASF80_06105 [Microbacterium sp. Leaf159]|nr:hypothetical protein ASF80_06105 [Microbacterium sp. Leaf159]